MLSYLQWFLNGFDSVLSPAELSDVYSCLAICIPVILTCAGVFSFVWACVGIFGGRK